MAEGTSILFGIFPIVWFIICGLFVLLGLTVLYLLIKFLLRANQALDIYLDEKKNRRL